MFQIKNKETRWEKAKSITRKKRAIYERSVVSAASKDTNQHPVPKISCLNTNEASKEREKKTFRTEQ